MRYVIYLLVLVNLVYYGWHMSELRKQEGIERALPTIPATAVPLVTLEEMEQKREQELLSVPEPAAETVMETEAGMESGVEPAPEPGPELAPQTWGDPEILEQVEQLAMIDSMNELQPPGGGGAITCRTLGPIMAVAQLKALSSKLDELGLEPRHRTSEKQETNGYWVYLPTMKYSEAQEIKKKLDEHRDREYYIGKNNYISLGTFREKSRADLRLKQVRKLELEALLKPRYETHTVHWLDIDRQTSDAVDLGAVMQEYPDIRLQEQSCY